MQQQWLQMATGRAVILARFSRWLVPAALLVVVPLFFIDLDRWIGDVPSELHAFAHVGFFGVLAWILMALPGLRARPFARRAAWVLLVVLLVSILVELVQTFFGRSAGLRDIWQNLVGAMAAVALHAPAGAGRRRLVGIAIALLALELAGPGIGLWDRAVARTQFPVLGDFETRFEHWRWSSGVPERTRARTGSRSLRVDLEPGRFAGTTLRRSFGDWSGFAYLEMSLYNPEPEALPIVVSIRDREHFRRGGDYADRFNGQFELEQGWNDLRIPVAGIRDAPTERRLELGDLSEMVVFTADLERPQVIWLDRVRLALE
jgi:hypothetical protein